MFEAEGRDALTAGRNDAVILQGWNILKVKALVFASLSWRMRGYSKNSQRLTGGKIDMDRIFSKWQPIVLSLLRFMSGLLLMQHGTAKLLGFPAMQNFANLQIGSMVGIAGIIELVGGALLVVGLFTRAAAFIASGMTAVAYFMVHAPQKFMPILNGGELAALYCFVFFYLVFAGGGQVSLDKLIRNKD